MTGNPKYTALLDDVCIGRGWCGGIVDGKPSHVNDLIPDSGPVTAEQFVEWLFIAEGVDPHAEPDKWNRHKAGLRKAFIQHMGAEIVDASALKGDAS